MSLFDILVAPETLNGVRNKVIGFAQGAGLKITNWIVGGVGQQVLETVTQTGYAFSQLATSAIRGFASLDTSTDPGDPDDFDPDNVNRTPARGFLSYFGENTFGTVREEASFATGFVTFTNAGAIARTFAPEALTFTWTGGTPPSPPPTYRNSQDPTIYAGGTVTVPAGSSIVIPIEAEEIGTRSNAPPSVLSLTTSLQGCSATNAAAVLGNDREDAAVYRLRCKQAPARVSLGGPSAAYEYLAAKNLDGTPLLNALGNPVNISRTYVSEDSDTGIVDAYFASPSGAATSDDVTAANANIEAEAFAVPDAITYTGLAAIEVSIHVVGTVKIKNRAGLTSTAVKNAIVSTLADAFADFPIGGMDQVLGAGVIYTEDLQGIVKTAYPGIYDVVISTPAGATTALLVGHVATLNSVVADWTVVIT